MNPWTLGWNQRRRKAAPVETKQTDSEAPPLVAPVKIVPPPKPELTPDQQEQLDAHMRKNAFQITCHPYDRGQCSDNAEKAVLALVNAPGASAQYIWTTKTRQWEFVPMPHMSTEQRCSERMGYMSIPKLRKALFEQMDHWLDNNDFDPLKFIAHEVRGGKAKAVVKVSDFTAGSQGGVHLRKVKQWIEMRDKLKDELEATKSRDGGVR